MKRNKRLSILEILANIPDNDWSIMETVVSKPARDILRQLRAEKERVQGKRELPEDSVLLEIERYRRRSGCSIGAAVAAFVRQLPSAGSNAAGGITVKLPDGRHITKDSAQKHFEQKFKKHEASVKGRVDAVEYGREMVHRIFRGLARGSTNSAPPATAVVPATGHWKPHIYQIRSGGFAPDPFRAEKADGIRAEVSRLVRLQRTG